MKAFWIFEKLQEDPSKSLKKTWSLLREALQEEWIVQLGVTVKSVELNFQLESREPANHGGHYLTDTQRDLAESMLPFNQMRLAKAAGEHLRKKTEETSL